MATSTGRSPAATGWATTTSQPHLDAALATLRVRAADWQNTSLGRRIELLDATIATTVAQAADWVAVCADIQQTADTPWAPEGWLTGVVPVVRYLALLRDTLDDIATNGRPQPPRMGTRPDGQVVVEVLPTSSADRLLFRDYLAEVRLTPGVALPEAQSRMGRIYREPPADGPQVALVLGAGNVSSLAPLNVLHQLFAERRVALLKSHPVLAPLGPLIGAAFAPLVEEGVFRLVYGGSDVGAALARHNDVDTIHLTGSIATYNALQAAGAQPADDRDVADGAQPADDRDASDGAATITTSVRRLDKPVHAELGNVTPVIVVPGPWTDRDLTRQARNIVSMLTNNGGFNCVTPRVLLQHHAWSSRRKLNDAIRSQLSTVAPRPAYYPGAADCWQAFDAAYPNAETFAAADNALGYRVAFNVDASITDQPLFTTEFFCGVMGEVGLHAATSIPQFIDRAVQFCNNTLWGTLAAVILVHPRSLIDAGVALAMERAIDRLDYGTVTVNQFAGATYGIMSAPWGAAPRSTPDATQSGGGFGHNTYLLADIDKVVVRGPFRSSIKSPWDHTRTNVATLGQRLTLATATGDPRQLAATAIQALRP